MDADRNISVRAALADLLSNEADKLLRRFPNIGGRLERLYNSTWGTTFWADLESEGFVAEAVRLMLVHKRRNSFKHGDPEALDDQLVNETMLSIENA